MRKLIDSILTLVLACGLGSSSAHAAACCTSAAAFGTGRLLVWESFAVGLRASMVNEIGSGQGDQWEIHNGNDYRRIDWRTEAWAMVGIIDRLSAFGVLPWVVPTVRRASANDYAYGYGLGDVQVGARYQALNIGEYAELPALALVATLSLPTGTVRDGDNEASTTGRGAWAVALGASIEKTWMPWYLQCNIGVNVPFFSNRPKPDEEFYWYGPAVQTNLAGGVELPKDIVVSLIASWNWEDRWHYTDNRNRDKPLSYATNLAIAASWRFHPHFTIQTSVASDIFVAPLIFDLPGNLTINFGVRYGYF